MNTLNTKAFRSLLSLLLFMAVLLFVPAWTLDYWQAWTFLAGFFGSSLAITVYLTPQQIATMIAKIPPMWS